MASAGSSSWALHARGKRERSENPAGVWVQQGGERLERILDRFGRGRFRLAPDSIATEASEVHRHVGAEHSLDVATVARPASGIRSTTYSASIVDRERGWNHHASPWGDRTSWARARLECYRDDPLCARGTPRRGNGARMRDESETARRVGQAVPLPDLMAFGHNRGL